MPPPSQLYVLETASSAVLGPVELVAKHRHGNSPTWTITVRDHGMLRARTQRPGGLVDGLGQGGAQAQWHREPQSVVADAAFELWTNAADRDRVLCLEGGTTENKNNRPLFGRLRTASRGAVLSAKEQQQHLASCCVFRVRPYDAATSVPLRTPTTTSCHDGTHPSAAAAAAQVLSPDEIAAFRRDGFVVRRGAADPARVDDALRLINRELFARGAKPEGAPDDAGTCEGLMHHDTILNTLRDSPEAWAVARELVGADAHSRQSAQIALREPAVSAESGGKDLSRLWHTDGMRKGEAAPFTLLVGIALSDQTQPGRGNFAVYPGTHHYLWGHYRKRLAATQGVLYGLDDDDKPRFDNHEEVLLAKGDVVFAHHLLAHRASTNFAPDIRYQLFFRITRGAAQKHRLLDDLGVPVRLFAEFDGVPDDGN